MNKISLLLCLIGFSLFLPAVSEASRPLALIYKGPGACSLDQGDAGESGYGCAEAAADVARAAGFQFKFVGPNDLSENPSEAEVKSIFKNARVWIQPGGIAVTAILAMSNGLKNQIVKFVSQGGGYVGFCAGAFLATDRIGSTRYHGFGILTGFTAPYGYESPDGLDFAFLETNWNGKKRAVYFEGGPYLYGQDSSAEVIATFADGYAAAVQEKFGKGRVSVSGPHPEAPAIWSAEEGAQDPDGSDLFLGVAMVRWAAGIN